MSRLGPGQGALRAGLPVLGVFALVVLVSGVTQGSLWPALGGALALAGVATMYLGSPPSDHPHDSAEYRRGRTVVLTALVAVVGGFVVMTLPW